MEDSEEVAKAPRGTFLSTRLISKGASMAPPKIPLLLYGPMQLQKLLGAPPAFLLFVYVFAGSSDCTLSSPVAEFGVLSRNAAELIEKLLLDIKSGWSGITGSLVPIVADETGVQDPLSAQNEHLQEIVKECTPGNVLLNSGEINAGLNPASLYVGVDQLASLLASVLNKCDTPNQKELKSEVAQAITSINEFCRTTHLSVEVADHISTLPEVLDTFYAFSAELFFSTYVCVCKCEVLVGSYIARLA